MHPKPHNVRRAGLQTHRPAPQPEQACELGYSSATHSLNAAQAPSHQMHPACTQRCIGKVCTRHGRAAGTAAPAAPGVPRARPGRCPLWAGRSSNVCTTCGARGAGPGTAQQGLNLGQYVGGVRAAATRCAGGVWAELGWAQGEQALQSGGLHGWTGARHLQQPGVLNPISHQTLAVNKRRRTLTANKVAAPGAPCAAPATGAPGQL